jgi:mannose-6-phosphate isomerase-like protein (cupin superfamily)
VLEVGKRYESPETGTWVRIAGRADGNMTFERGFVAGTGRTDPHLHEDLTQTWEALSGDGRIEVDGEERAFAAGDRVAIPPGVRHRDPWNPGPDELQARGIFEPDNDFVESYAAAYAHRLTAGGLNDQDEMPLLQILVIAQATKGRSYGSSPPVPVQRALLPLLAAVGRLRGYRPSYD